MEKKLNVLIGVNALLVIAVIVLFVLYLNTGKTTSGDDETVAYSGEGLRVAYVNTDSVLSQYELVRIMEAKLEGEGEAMKKELQRREQNLRQHYAEYQQRVKNDNISIDEAKQTEEALMRQQEELMLLQEEYSTQYANKTMGMNQELVDTVRTFLDRYNKKKNFDYILAKSSANNNILFARDTFDITSELVDKMNKEYKKNRK